MSKPKTKDFYYGMVRGFLEAMEPCPAKIVTALYHLYHDTSEATLDDSIPDAPLAKDHAETSTPSSATDTAPQQEQQSKKRAFRPWTAKDDAQLDELLKDKTITLKKLKKAMNRDGSTLLGRLERRGVKLAKEATARPWLTGRSVFWTDDRLEELRRFVIAGMPMESIKAYYKKSDSAITAQIWRLQNAGKLPFARASKQKAAPINAAQVEETAVKNGWVTVNKSF